MNGKRSGLLSLYRAVTTALAPAAPLLLGWRLRRGKEDGARQRERFGFAGLSRPAGRLVWLHGASVGECLAMLPLTARLAARGFRVLVTSGTRSSAEILAKRLPAGAAHQYLPYDAPQFVRRFLDHWRPGLVLVAESELWPNLLHETHARAIPLALINARLSQRSFERWQKAPRLIGAMLGGVGLCLAQTREDALRLERLGAPRVVTAGNLKYDAPAPPADPMETAALKAAIGPRPVWLAASTHAGEEAVIADVHARLTPSMPGLLTIIAPRHAARGPEIAAQIRQAGVGAALRSQGAEIDASTSLYIADTMGELGLFYRAASVVFLGKSIGGASGGQNPIEPAKLGAAVLHGPDVANFEEVYRALDAAQGAIAVADAGELADAIADLLGNPARIRAMAQASGETVERFGGATANIMRALEPWLAPADVESPS